MVHWQPFGKRFVGRLSMNWVNKFEKFSRTKQWFGWQDRVARVDQWMMEMDEFVEM